MLLVALDRKQTNCVLGDNFPQTLFTVNGKNKIVKRPNLATGKKVLNINTFYCVNDQPN